MLGENIFYNDDMDSHDLIAIVTVVVLVVDWDDIKNVEENCGLGHYLLVGSSSWLQLANKTCIITGAPINCFDIMGWNNG